MSLSTLARSTPAPHTNARSPRLGKRDDVQRLREAASFAAETLEPRLLMAVNMIRDVPFYPWFYGCTPTVIGEVLGTYARRGLGNIFPGSPATSEDAIVKNTIASTAHQVAGLENGRLTYDGKTAGAGDYQNSKSYPTHQQHPDCIADFIKTVGGEVQEGYIAPGITQFLKWRGYTGWTIKETYFGPTGFQDIVNSINAGRPVMALVDLLGEGKAGHSAPIVGYNTANQTLAFDDASVQGLPGSTSTIQWAYYGPVTVGQIYGILSYFTIVPPTASMTFSSTPITVPGKIEAENYDLGGDGLAFHDTTSYNLGGAYRLTEGVDIGVCTDTGGGYYVGWTQASEWLKYTVNVTQNGYYQVNARIASPVRGGTFHVEVDDGTRKTESVLLPSTGGFQTWSTLNAGAVYLTAGTHVLKVAMDGEPPAGMVGNFNWFTLTRLSTAPAVGNAPFTGTNAHISAKGGTIYSIDFDKGGEGYGYHRLGTVNDGGQYRNTSVGIQSNSDGHLGYNVGWTRPGEWLAYTVNIDQAGIYSLSTRVASGGLGGLFHLDLDGKAITGSIRVNDTGGWDTWGAIVKNNIKLPAGKHVLHIVMDTGGAAGYVANFNWFKFTRTA